MANFRVPSSRMRRLASYGRIYFRGTCRLHLQGRGAALAVGYPTKLLDEKKTQDGKVGCMVDEDRRSRQQRTFQSKCRSVSRALQERVIK
jgi:hypothetical protein